MQTGSIGQGCCPKKKGQAAKNVYLQNFANKAQNRGDAFRLTLARAVGGGGDSNSPWVFAEVASEALGGWRWNFA